MPKITTTTALTFTEKHVPDPEHRGPGQTARVDAHEPLGHVENRLDVLPLLQNKQNKGGGVNKQRSVPATKKNVNNKCSTHQQTVGRGREPAEEGRQHAPVNFNLLQVVRKVPANVVVVEGDQRPEGVLCGHVHQQHRRNGALRLAVALRRAVRCKGLEDVEELSLAGAGTLRKELVAGKLAMEVLGDVAARLLGNGSCQEVRVERRPAALLQVAAAEVEPGLGAQRVGNALAAAVANLLPLEVDVVAPVVQHLQPLLLAGAQRLHLGGGWSREKEKEG